MSRAALSLALHSHMPYVEGFGTWPFGQEWLRRRAELHALHARPSPRALRELLRSSAPTGAFMLAHGTAGEYPRERAEGHGEALAGHGKPALRNLAPHLAA